MTAGSPELARPAGGPTSAGRPAKPTTVEPPRLALPTSSLRGIGETLDPVSRHGGLGFRIPVAMAPARGPHPDLTLAYDSSAGNSAFGLGWDVPLPAIARKTERGIPRYTDDDRFVLIGSDDLVRVTELSSPAPFGGSGELTQVTRYRTRTEGGFVRVERHRGAIGETFWVTFTPDNVMTVYGRTADARVADPERPGHVFSWLPEDVFDDRGNHLHYRWAPEDGPVHAQRYLREVVTVNATPVADRFTEPVIDHTDPAWRDRFHVTVVFDYGDCGQTPEPVRDWPSRPDAFSTRRPGFEVRTQRLCRRVLTFHRFPGAAGWSPVSATELTHDGDPTGAKLTQVTVVGLHADGSTLRHPPLRFGYRPWAPAAGPVPLPVDGAGPPPYPWVDLDGDGAPGILRADGSAWYHQANLGGGTFAPATPRGQVPAAAPGHPPDLAAVFGDGRLAVIDRDGSTARYAVRDPFTTQWRDWLPFAASPVLDWTDPRLRQVDLDGDGRTDLLRHDGETLTWHRFLGPDGWEPALSSPVGEDGPLVALDDPTAAVRFADMTGDGLEDIVQVRPGSVRYWPNLGYGRFGPPVTMAAAPVLDSVDEFDPERVRLVDLDGTGVADLLYTGRDGVLSWTNLSGNGWAAEAVVTPLIVPDVELDIVDLLGKGTRCLVFADPLAPSPRTALRYVDLFPDGRPGLLTSVDNGRGLRTEIDYASSTQYAMADRRAGRPWSTPLPTPVQVVSAVTVTDQTTGVASTASYRYRDGYYDVEEREFRGFGQVVHADTDVFRAFVAGPPGQWLEQVDRVPPQVSVTWYHTGAPAQSLPEHRLADEWEPGVDRVEGLRALRGKVLRTAVYALDGTAESRFPYTATEQSYRVRLLDPAAGDPDGHAVTVALPSQSVDLSVERVPVDDHLCYPDPDYVAGLPPVGPAAGPPPRGSHTFAVTVNDWGQVERSLSVAYGRTDPAARATQRASTVLATDAVFANLVTAPGVHRLGVPLSEHRYEVLAAPGGRLEPATAASLAGAPVLTGGGPPATPVRRTLGVTRTRYWDDTVTAELPDGVTGTRAQVRRVLTAALTEHQLDLLRAEVDAGRLTAAGYLRLPDDNGQPLYWTPGPVTQPDPARFHLTVAHVDALGLGTFVTYDAAALLPVRTLTAPAQPMPATPARFEPVGPSWNVVQAQYDYRVLAPTRVTDAHGVVNEGEYDVLGALVRSRKRGAAGEGAPAGEWDAEFVHHRDAWAVSATPQWTESRVRESFAADSRWQRAISYLDGAGRPLLSKVEAEAGLAPFYEADGRLALGADGRPLTRPTPARWIGNGRTVYDGKGRPVATYDPYFAPDDRYEDEAVLATTGHPVFVRYDPVGRVHRTDFPDGTFDVLRRTPWSVATWDRADTVLDSAWYQRASAAGAHPDDQAAAVASAVHAGTPSITHLDPRGLAVESVERVGVRDLTTWVEHDGAGRVVAVTDPRGVVLRRGTYDLIGNTLVATAPDTGEQRAAYDALGRVVLAWSGCFGWTTATAAYAVRVRTVRDVFGRERAAWVRHAETGDQTEVCRVAIGYGDDAPAYAAPRYLLGRQYQVFDGAGLAETLAADFLGNTVHTRRRFAVAYDTEPDWSAVASVPPSADRSPAAGGALEAAGAQARIVFDALSRPVATTGADASVIEIDYHRGGQVAAVHLTPRAGVRRTVQDQAVYDVLRRPELIGYGPAGGVAQVRTDYDELTQRVVRLRATRPGEPAPLQDLHLRYDAVGNILGVRDSAQSTRYFRNAVVTADRDYRYDDSYRLVEASGRELAGLVHAGGVQPPVQDLPDPGDLAAVARYRETYIYDDSGNLTEIGHVQQGQAGARWTRSLTPDAAANRLSATAVTGDVAGVDPVAHDSRGNLTVLGPRVFTWGWHGAPRRAVVHGNVTAYYHYAADGTRARKIVLAGAKIEDHRWFGVTEFNTVAVNGVLSDAAETVRVSAGDRVVALAERATVVGRAPVNRAPVIRYQIGDQLDSVALELDDAGNPLTYEEFHPYGTTAYQSSLPGVSLKRYRFTAKERDDETGLSYHGARYYAPWLGRWISPDPAGLVDGGNRYAYCRGRPTFHTDPTGHASVPADFDCDLGARGPTPAPENPQLNAAVQARLLRDTKESLERGSRPLGNLHYPFPPRPLPIMPKFNIFDPLPTPEPSDFEKYNAELRAPGDPRVRPADPGLAPPATKPGASDVLDAVSSEKIASGRFLTSLSEKVAVGVSPGQLALVGVSAAVPLLIGIGAALATQKPDPPPPPGPEPEKSPIETVVPPSGNKLLIDLGNAALGALKKVVPATVLPEAALKVEFWSSLPAARVAPDSKVAPPAGGEPPKEQANPYSGFPAWEEKQGRGFGFTFEFKFFSDWTLRDLRPEKPAEIWPRVPWRRWPP